MKGDSADQSGRRLSLANWLLCATAVLLAAGNLLSRPKASSPNAAPAIANTSAAEPEKPIAQTVVKKHELEVSSSPAFSWAPVESADYKTYIGNLRKLGFPEELIREIVIADMDKLYAPREEQLRFKQAPYDAPLSQRRRPPTVEDVQNMAKFRDLEVEKQHALEELLGTHIPREMIRSPLSRNYEGYEYAISVLPVEKQDAVQRIQEDEFIQDDFNQAQYGDGPGKLERYKQLNEVRDAALKQILTPEEFDKYMMNSTPPGTEMARRIIGMEPTDDEMLKIWHLTLQQWTDQGGVYGRWRATPVPSEQIQAADDKLNEGLRATLGEDRYLDYQMAVSDTGQQLRNFASRYDLPRETLADAFQLQTQLDQLSKRPIVFNGGSAPNGGATPAEQFTDLRQRLESLLGSDLFQAWNSGRRQKYDIQP
jgi:hypothetical protein